MEIQNYTRQYLQSKIYQIASKKRKISRELLKRMDPQKKRQLKKEIKKLNREIKQAREDTQGILDFWQGEQTKK